MQTNLTRYQKEKLGDLIAAALDDLELPIDDLFSSDEIRSHIVDSEDLSTVISWFLKGYLQDHITGEHTLDEVISWFSDTTMELWLKDHGYVKAEE